MWKNPDGAILITLHKLNSKWIKDLSIKLDTPNLIGKKLVNNLELIGEDKTFWKEHY